MVEATVDILLNQIEGETAPNRIRIDGPLITRGSVKERTPS
jgi:DNA-binding LacI/PurR family transcriptional regulator